MRSGLLIAGGALVAGWLALASPVLAEEAAAGVAEAAPLVAIEDEDPEIAELDAELAELTGVPAALAADVDVDAEAFAAPSAPLGEIGYDNEGNQGRLHVVVGGDTLWDISDAYLGSAWVWPSIWQDNGEIENPHLIHPGERIWISATEMRRVTREEANALLAGVPAAPAEEEPLAAAPEPEPEPELIVYAPDVRPMIRVSSLEASDLVNSDELDSAATIVDAVSNRMMLSQGDTVYIGLGSADVRKGDQFTVFRNDEPVMDPDSGELLGHHVDVVGWVEIQAADRETSRGRIVRSFDEVERGDKVMPRDPSEKDVVIGPSPSGVDGKLSFMANRRTLGSHIDFVYLNRGTFDGLSVGSPLEVYRQGYAAPERASNRHVQIPDRVIGQLIVVRASGRSSVAFVANTNVELEVGDRFRGATGLPQVSSGK